MTDIGGVTQVDPIPTNQTATALGGATQQNPTNNVDAGQNAAIQNLTGQEAMNPSLPSGTQQVPALLSNDPNQELAAGTGQVQGNVAAQQTSAGPSAQVQADFNSTAAQYDPTLLNGNVAHGTINNNDLVSGQFENLTAGMDNGQIPDWARNTVNTVNDQLAGRGMANSSIAAGAITSAIFAAALPIAQANASANMQMDMANLSYEQQGLLSDQAASNAASQFNATSQNQTTQFFANLMTQIATQNAARSDAMAQFNAGQANSLAQFNAQLQNQRDQFNAQNQLVVDQSNVQWRRTINTTNTAAINATNQVNAQNLFNQSQTAQANLWQQWRDEASWANTAQQNAETRAHNLAVAALSRQTAFDLNNQAETQQLYQLMGQFGLNVLNASLKG